MAVIQPRPSVPARWRFLFAAVVMFAFFAAALHLSRPEKPSAPEQAENHDLLSARIRLQTAAMAFSTGKLSPRIAVITDRPEIYAPGDGIPREFQPIPEPVPVVFPSDETATCLDLYKHLCRAFEASKTPEHPNGQRFDLVLVDKTFPERIYSPHIGIWSSCSMFIMGELILNYGGVLAVELPQDRPEAAACIMVAMRRVFGNAGTFRFGKRVVAASVCGQEKDSAGTGPIFHIEKLNELAELAGYYSVTGVPSNAISLVLGQEYSGTPPARLLEDVYRIRFMPGQGIGAAEYLRAELLARVCKVFPAGIPFGTGFAWATGIALLLYLLLRYFIAWKPVHKQAFLAFEDMFYLTGCASLCMMNLPACVPEWIPLVVFAAAAVLFASAFPDFFFRKKHSQPASGSTSRSRISKAVRIGAALLICIAFALAVSSGGDLVQAGEDLAPKQAMSKVTLFILLSDLPWILFLNAVVPLVVFRLKSPVQPGPEIPAAFVLGSVLALAAFAVSFCFPAGPVVFAVTVCGFRVVYSDN
jgi:hypothetical protein